MDPNPRLIFLGTGGDAIVVGKQLRSAGGLILQVEGNQFHIDPGPGALAKANEFGVNMRDTIAVLVSHNHLNHSHDINAVLSAMTLGGMDSKGVLVTNRTAFNGTDEIEPFLTNHFKRYIERNIILEPGQRVGINEIEVIATRAEHTDPNTIGFKFITPKFALGYTSDTGYFSKLSEDYKDVDIMVFNTVYGEEKKDKNQLSSDDVLRLIGEIKPKLAVLTHFGIKLHQGDILNLVRKIQKETKVQTIAAKEGMAINPLSYSVSLRQKTLNLY